jgi:TRAP-type C4-dicarboxylate transport system permease small subunit
LKGLLAWADRLLMAAAGLVVVVLLGTVMAGVVSRALNHPLGWTDEASGFLMVWLACLGWMLATRHGAHIRIGVFQDRLPRAAWRATEVAVLLAVALLGGVLAFYSVHLIRTNADMEAMSLPVSAAWLYVPLLPAGLVTLLQALADLARVLRRRGALPHGTGDAVL